MLETLQKTSSSTAFVALPASGNATKAEDVQHVPRCHFEGGPDGVNCRKTARATLLTLSQEDDISNEDDFSQEEDVGAAATSQKMGEVERKLPLPVCYTQMQGNAV